MKSGKDTEISNINISVCNGYVFTCKPFYMHERACAGNISVTWKNARSDIKYITTDVNIYWYLIAYIKRMYNYIVIQVRCITWTMIATVTMIVNIMITNAQPDIISSYTWWWDSLHISHGTLIKSYSHKGTQKSIRLVDHCFRYVYRCTHLVQVLCPANTRAAVCSKRKRTIIYNYSSLCH